MAIITTLQSHVRSGGPLNTLALDALVSGAEPPIFMGDNVQYTIHNESMTPSEAKQVQSAPDTTIEDYLISRFVKTADLANDLPVTLPNSSITIEDVTRQLTFAELDDRPTRSVDLKSDGFFYCVASAADDCRGLTLEEYQACLDDGVELINRMNLPSDPE